MVFCTPILLWLLSGVPYQDVDSQAMRSVFTSKRACTTRPGATAFIENRGQWNTPASYIGRFGAVSVLVEPGAIGLLLPEPGHPERGSFVRLRLVNPSPDCSIQPEQRIAGIESFFLGNDPTRWASGLPRWGKLRISCAWEGVDLVLREHAGELEYDVEVSPGADLDVVRFDVEGCEGLTHESDRLGLRTSVETIWQKIPACWQTDAAGTHTPIECLWIPDGSTRFGLCAPERQPHQALVVDPQLLWGTYIGSADGEDAPTGLARTEDGDYVLTGFTAHTTSFPQTPGTYQHPNGPTTDVVVVRVDGTTGTLVYSSVIGGTNVEFAWAGVSLDQWGGPIVAGQVSSSDFPTTPGAFDPVMSALQSAAFVLRLSPMADQLIYSTYIEAAGVFAGGKATGLAAYGDGSVVVVGKAYDAGFPTTAGSYDPTYNGNEDAFVLRLNPSGSSLVWSTFLGGPINFDDAHAVVIGAREDVTVTGFTGDPQFPVTSGAYSVIPPGPQTQRQAFVTRFTPSGDALEWSTFLGGSRDDRAWALALDAEGGVVVGGDTVSSDFPVTPGAAQSNLSAQSVPNTDGFVARLNSTGSQLIYGTYLGGTTVDSVFGIAIDASGIATVTGKHANGPTFPRTPGAYNWNVPVHADGILTRLGPRGELLYSTSLGSPVATGSGIDVVRDPNGRVALVGNLYGPGFPTTPGVFGPAYFGGGNDITLAQLDLLFEGVELRGASTPSCQGPLEAQAGSWPKSGMPGFFMWCSQAPPHSNGFLLLGTAASTPTTRQGVDVWISLGQPYRRVPVITDSDGWIRVPIEISSRLPGFNFAGQFLIRNTPTCGTQRWCASNAVDVTVQ